MDTRVVILASTDPRTLVIFCYYCPTRETPEYTGQIPGIQAPWPQDLWPPLTAQRGDRRIQARLPGPTLVMCRCPG